MSQTITEGTLKQKTAMLQPQMGDSGNVGVNCASILSLSCMLNTVHDG